MHRNKQLPGIRFLVFINQIQRKMAFRKGISGNPSGRPKGKSNKITSRVRTIIEGLLTQNEDKIKSEFSLLTGKDLIRAWADLLPYVIPKLNAVNVTSDLERILKEASEKGHLNDSDLEKIAQLIYESHQHDQ